MRFIDKLNISRATGESIPRINLRLAETQSQSPWIENLKKGIPISRVLLTGIRTMGIKDIERSPEMRQQLDILTEDISNVVYDASFGNDHLTLMIPGINYNDARKIKSVMLNQKMAEEVYGFPGRIRISDTEL